jgi:ATP-dependent Clp protease adaptor protein ClpS
MSQHDSDTIEKTETKVEDEVKEPPMYKVLLHNDNFTTKEFVVQILMSVFHKSAEEAAQLMWQVHSKGRGVCGVYPFEVAETKVTTVTHIAREHGYPLKTTLEEE